MYFYDIFGNDDSLSYFLPSSNIIEFQIDHVNDDIFVFSNTTSEGTEAIVIHFFKIFNILAWEN